MPTERTSKPDQLAIEARSLDKWFGQVHAVRQVDLNIPRARIYGFLGPNGSGKSTTIRMLCGLLTPSAGDIRVLGHAIPAEAERLRHKVGYMTQKFSLYQDLTSLENLQFIANIYGLRSAQRHQRIEANTRRYGLEKLLNQRAATMSGGQKQRLALACATLHEPELLFLDEPTSAVDPENRRDFWESLFDLVEEGTTVLVSTHYMDEAERCHALAILDRGSLVAEGSPAHLARDIPAQVVLLETPQPRAAGQQLHRQPWVLSVAQIGRQLRVLVREDQPSAAEAVAAVVRAGGITVEVSALVRASLEDVFVAATKTRAQAA